MNVRRVVAILVLAILAVVMPSSASASITPTPETRIGNFELREPALIGFVVSRTVENHRAKSILCADLASQRSLRWKGMWRFDFGGGELYDARARMWSPALGAFLSVDEYAFHDSRSTLWGWPHQNPTRWSDPFGRGVTPPGGHWDVGLFTSGQITSIFDASGQAALSASHNWDAGNYGSAYVDFAGSVGLFEAGIAASLLAKRPATSADFAMMACPIDIPAGGAAGAADAAAADAAIAAHAAKHFPKLSPQQLAAKIADVRSAGTTIVAPNGNALTYVKDGTILIDNRATGEAGTIFKPDNTKDFINQWLGENR